MKQFETEAILLAGSLNDLARCEHYCAHPMAALGLLTLVDEQQARLEYAPKLCPGFECATHLQGGRSTGVVKEIVNINSLPLLTLSQSASTITAGSCREFISSLATRFFSRR